MVRRFPPMPHRRRFPIRKDGTRRKGTFLAGSRFRNRDFEDD